MAKNSKSLSRKYLKILGIVTIVMAVLTVITGVAVFFVKDMDYMGALTGAAREYVEQMNWNNDTLRVMAGSLILAGGIFSIVEGWLLVRAANDPAKSTLLLVLVVLSCIFGAVTLFEGGFKDISVVLGNGVSLAINVLAFIAVLNARKEING